MRLDLDTDIRYPDGQRAGVLRKVVLDAHDQATEVVMATEGLISRNVIVPVSLLSEAPGQVLTINANREQVDDLPDYKQDREPAMPGSDWQPSRNAAPGGDVFPATIYEPNMPIVVVSNIPEGSVPVSQGTEVWCLDGRWGIVDDVLLDDAGKATAFIARPDATDEHDRIVPLSLVREFNSDTVLLNCTLADLPAYTQEAVLGNQEPDE